MAAVAAAGRAAAAAAGRAATAGAALAGGAAGAPSPAAHLSCMVSCVQRGPITPDSWMLHAALISLARHGLDFPFFIC